jgi:hypothetical protein
MSVMLLISGIIFLICGSADVQQWAMPKSVDDDNDGYKEEKIVVVK